MANMYDHFVQLAQTSALSESGLVQLVVDAGPGTERHQEAINLLLGDGQVANDHLWAVHESADELDPRIPVFKMIAVQSLVFSEVLKTLKGALIIEGRFFEDAGFDVIKMIRQAFVDTGVRPNKGFFILHLTK